MRVRAIILLLVTAISCQGIEPLEKPDNLIPLKTMEEIMYDMTIINAARGYNIQLFRQTGVKPESHIFEKYEIDSLQYVESTVYYSADVEEYKKLINTVKKKIELEFKVADSISKEEKRVQDSIRNKKGKRLKQKKDSTIRVKRNKGRVVPKTVIEPKLDIQN